MVTVDADLTAAATEAGIDLTTDPVMKYLRAIKIITSSAISVYFQDDASVTDLVKKLEGKFTYKGNDYVLGGEDVNAVIAQWKVLYGETRAKYQARLAATTSSPTPTPTTPTATSASTDKDNVPKTLPQGVYAQLIKDYNNITLDGEKRTFPEKILLGADKVLARMYHEHHTSKHYTAVTLGEIMSQRVFTSLGTVNANRKKDDLDKRLIVDNKQQLVTKEPPDWDVRGISMILDGIEAVKWAWILIKFGTEKSVIKYCDWFTTLVRKNNARLTQIKTLWEAFAWDIAMRMRQNETFPVVAEEIMQDLTTVNDALMQSPKKKQRNDQELQRWRTPKGQPGKGKGNKGKTKGTGKQWQWPQQAWTTTWQSPAFPPQPPNPSIPAPMPMQQQQWPTYNQTTWNAQPQAFPPAPLQNNQPSKGKPGKDGKGNKGRGRGKGQH